MGGGKNVGLKIFEEIMNENVPELEVYMDLILEEPIVQRAGQMT